MNDLAKNLLLWVVILVVLISVFQSFANRGHGQQPLAYSDFLEQVKQGQVAEVKIAGDLISGELKGGARFETISPETDNRSMVGTLIDLPLLHPVTQDDRHASHAPKIDKAEARIDFTREAESVERQVRAFAPAPGAFFELGGERYRVLKACIVERKGGKAGTVLDDALTIACGTDAIRPVQIQRAGKPAMTTAELLRGRAIPVGTVIG